MKTLLDHFDLSQPGLTAVAAAVARQDLPAAGEALLAHFLARRTERCLNFWDLQGPEDYAPMPWGASPTHDQLWKNLPDRVLEGRLYASGREFDFSRDEEIDWVSGIYWAGGKYKPVDQARAMLRRMYWLRALDLNYLRGDAATQEKAARQFERLMVSWMEFSRWTKDEFAVNSAIRLADALSQSGMIRSWYVFLASPVLGSEFKLRLLEAILTESADVMERAVWNPWIWGLSEAGGLSLAGILYPECKAAAAWRQRSFDFVNRFFQTELRPDGTLRRFHFCPHYAGATAVWPLAYFPLIAKLGYTNFLEPAAQAGVVRIVDWIATVQKPDNTIAQLNGSDIQGFARWLASSAEVYQRPDWLAIATAGREGRLPADTSRILPDAGAFMLRTGFTRDDMVACFHNGDYHNVDRPSLNLDLYALGRTLVTAPGRYGYYQPEWPIYFTTAGYNTLMVDGSPPAVWGEHSLHQSPGLGNVCWRLGADVDWAWGTHPTGFDAAKEVHWQRGLLFAKGEYWLVVDRILGPGEHDFSLRWLLTPSTTVVEADQLSVHTRNEDANVRLVPAVPPGTHLEVWHGHRNPFRGWYSPENGVMIPSPQLEYTWRGHAPQLTAMLIVPYREHVPAHSLTLTETKPGVHEVVVHGQNREDRLILDLHGAGSAQLIRSQDGRVTTKLDLTA